MMNQTVTYKNGNILSYAEYGDKNGYPILIQHGLIASIHHPDLFERLIQLGARLICIARPGYGESSPVLMNQMADWAEIVSVLIDQLGLSHFDVLGMSSGAPYSYALGCKFPEKARNIFIFSGIPALYDEEVLSFWPYPVSKNASMAEMEKLTFDLFFSNLSQEDLEKDDIQDSMMNHGFGIAQDLKIRTGDWGFKLADVNTKVWMRHSKTDHSVPFITAELTSKLLPNCMLDVRENDDHFSKELLDDFIRTVMFGHYGK